MPRPAWMQKLARVAFITTSILLVITALVWGYRLYLLYHIQQQAQAQAMTNIDSGIPLAGNPAPNFTLVDQFNQPVTLTSLRGYEVVLAFIDSRCTTLCPLTAEIMYDARSHFKSSSSSQIKLVAINANTVATSVAEVQAWSIKHGMLYQWSFLTGTADQLQAVYKAYNIYAQTDSQGVAVHDPSMFIIDAKGRAQLFFETLNSNTKADLSSEELGLEAGMQQWLPQS